MFSNVLGGIKMEHLEKSTKAPEGFLMFSVGRIRVHREQMG